MVRNPILTCCACYLTGYHCFLIAFITFVFLCGCSLFSSSFFRALGTYSSKEKCFISYSCGKKKRSFLSNKTFFKNWKARQEIESKFLPQIALSQMSLVLQTLYQAFCRPPSSISHIHCALTILHFPTMIGLTKHKAALFMALLFNCRQGYLVLFMLGMISSQNRHKFYTQIYLW